MQDSKGVIFIISGPSGVGKSTLVAQLLKLNPSLKRAITFTTRSIRESEVNGVHYHFVNKDRFDQLDKEGAFLESIKIFNNYYATGRKEVQEILRGCHCLLVLETVGAKKIMQELNVVSIFVQALSLDVLKERMLHRKSESQESLELRMGKVQEQMREIKYFDYIVTNNDFTIALKQLNSIIVAQDCKNKRKKL